MGRILLIDDEASMRRILAFNLRQDQHEILEAGGVQEAQRMLAANDFDVVITDQKMPDGEGLAVLASAHTLDCTLSVIVLTAVATIELAVESMRQGAFDFVTKPFQPDVVRATVRRACERTRLMRENVLLKDTVVRLEGASEIYGESEHIQGIRERIARVAPTHATVLITGETGTGKELVARAIRRNSPRNAKPFVAVNCAAFTETLLESELFGHEKGVFTGADHSRQGLFEAAHEGTLFLDEAGEMSLAAQAKLLRILTDGQLLRVGSTRPRRVDVRVLVATRVDGTWTGGWLPFPPALNRFAGGGRNRSSAPISRLLFRIVSPFDQVLEFPEIAGKTILLQHLQGFRTDVSARHLEFNRHLPAEHLAETRNVF